MKLNSFAAKVDIESYLTESAFNFDKYIELTQNPLYIGLFEPLAFLNLFWMIHQAILDNKSKPLKIIKYLYEFDLNQKQRFYLFDNLLAEFNISFYDSNFIFLSDTQLNTALNLIKIELNKISIVLFLHPYVDQNCYDINIVKHKLLYINKIDAKIKFLHAYKIDYQQQNSDLTSLDNLPFVIQINLEINRIDIFIKYTSPPADPLTSPLSPPDPLNFPDQRTENMRNLIVESICSVDVNLKWRYFFETEADYMLFIEILTGYFAENKVITDCDIQLQERCNTKLCSELNSIYHELCSKTLKNNKDFFKILKNFSFFKNKSNIAIYSLLKS